MYMYVYHQASYVLHILQEKHFVVDTQISINFQVCAEWNWRWYDSQCSYLYLSDKCHEDGKCKELYNWS